VTGGEYVWTDNANWKTVCDAASHRCDWHNVYDTGAGHSITAVAENGPTIYAAWCGGGCNVGGSHPFTSGIATNFHGAWHQIDTSSLPLRYIQGVTVDPANPAHVYAIFNGYSRRWIPSAGVGHVFESWNGGATWNDISGDLPDIPSDALVLVSGQLVLATDIGAFIAPAGDGIHPVVSLGVQPAEHIDQQPPAQSRRAHAARRDARPRPVERSAPVTTLCGRGRGCGPFHSPRAFSASSSTSASASPWRGTRGRDTSRARPGLRTATRRSTGVAPARLPSSSHSSMRRRATAEPTVPSPIRPTPIAAVIAAEV
jgi:hypothetical protein